MKLLPLAVLICVVPAAERPTKRICVVVDVSGSMETNGRIQQALKLVGELSRQPVDDGWLAAHAFDMFSSRYPGGWRLRRPWLSRTRT